MFAVVPDDIPAGACDAAWLTAATTTSSRVQCPTAVSVRQQVPVRPPCFNQCTNTSHCQSCRTTRYRCLAGYNFVNADVDCVRNN